MPRMLANAATLGDPKAQALAIEQELWAERRASGPQGRWGRDNVTVTDTQFESLQRLDAASLLKVADDDELRFERRLFCVGCRVKLASDRRERRRRCRSYVSASVSIGSGARNSLAFSISKTGLAKCATRRLVSGAEATPACAVTSHSANRSIIRDTFTLRFRLSVN